MDSLEDLRRGITMLMDFTVTLPTIDSVKDAAVVTEGDVVIATRARFHAMLHGIRAK